MHTTNYVCTLPQIPGVSYRGRVMVEVDVTLGELPATKQEPIKTSDLERATVSINWGPLSAELNLPSLGFLELPASAQVQAVCSPGLCHSSATCGCSCGV